MTRLTPYSGIGFGWDIVILRGDAAITSNRGLLGHAVIGRLLVDTVFTVFSVPCAYAIIYSGRTGKAGIMRKKLSGKRVALAAIFLCVLYVGYRIYESRGDAALLPDKTVEETVPTVAVVYPKPGLSTETITLPGNIVGWYEAPMYARVTGYVKMWYKDYGDEVKKGDILAEINAPDLDAEYAQAKADLETERARYQLTEVTAKRWVALRPNHAVSEQSITVKEQERRAQAAVVKAAEQKIRNVDAFIGFKTIVAPFDGVVTQRNINVGDLVSKEGNLSAPNAISNLFTVAVVDILRLFVSVPESFGPFLQPARRPT